MSLHLTILCNWQNLLIFVCLFCNYLFTELFLIAIIVKADFKKEINCQYKSNQKKIRYQLIKWRWKQHQSCTVKLYYLSEFLVIYFSDLKSYLKTILLNSFKASMLLLVSPKCCLLSLKCLLPGFSLLCRLFPLFLFLANFSFKLV